VFVFVRAIHNAQDITFVVLERRRERWA